jgi:hypothetical protein
MAERVIVVGAFEADPVALLGTPVEGVGVARERILHLQ